jgi:hypothetical protein
VNAQVRVLFSIDTALAYSKLMALIRPTFGQELVEGRISLGEFLETRNAALYALYVEAGVIPCDRRMPNVFEQLKNQYRTARLDRVRTRSDPGHQTNTAERDEEKGRESP